MASNQAEVRTGAGGAIVLQPPIGWRDAGENPPPPVDYVLPGMEAGTVGALVSPGGVGKSMLALQVAAQIAGGPDLLGLGDLPTGRAVYLPAEDSPAAIRHRMHALWWCMTPAQQEAVDKGVTTLPLVGRRPNLLDDRWLDWLLGAAEGCRLMVLDPLRRFHASDENDSSQMTQVVGRMESIAASTGCAVLYLHHATKSAAMTGAGAQQQASRGSSVLTDNVRWQGYLAAMASAEAGRLGISEDRRGEYVRFGVSKANSGRLVRGCWLRRHEGGVLRHDPSVACRMQQDKTGRAPRGKA